MLIRPFMSHPCLFNSYSVYKAVVQCGFKSYCSLCHLFVLQQQVSLRSLFHVSTIVRCYRHFSKGESVESAVPDTRLMT